MYSFDGQNREIILNTGITEVDVTDMYSRWKDWAVLSDNSKYAEGIRVVGGDDLGGGLRVPSFFFMANGWRVRTHGDGSQIVFALNLYDENGDDPFIAVGQDKIVNKVSDIPGLDGSSLITPEVLQAIADAVWNKEICL